MIARVLIVASATLMSVGATAAEPSPPPREGQQASASAPRLLLASADDVHLSPAAQQQAPEAPKPRRIARVTSCRCGDVPTQQQDQQ